MPRDNLSRRTKPSRFTRGLYSHRLHSAISRDSAPTCIGPSTNAATESLSIDSRGDRFESSESLHPSRDLARADRIVNRLPDEMADRYALRKPLVIELERIAKDCVIASFLDSDSHMSGKHPVRCY